jgi:23S rRNA (cytidine1920-2'-O)/16S rRNA (cytidine1409-2'-O)-methyltransferase
MRQRLDVLLVEMGLADSRARAQALIRSGSVRVNHQVFDKPGMAVPVDAQVEVRAAPPYVSRGGLKLASALDAFPVHPGDRLCLDVGASTGGFTDVLLQRGARHVLAVDVGRGQLAWALRQDPRVTNMERTDIRALTRLPDRPSLAVVDVAFISLRLVLPAVARHLAAGGDVIALVKPQFEAGRGAVGRGGVIRDPGLRRQVLADVLTWMVADGWSVRDILPSPITGGDGNQEYLVWLRPGEGQLGLPTVAELVARATRLEA